MDSAIKLRWLKALRSGAYEQGKGFLRKHLDKDCFCALGVLCDLYAKEHKIDWELNLGKSGRYSILGRWDIPTSQIIAWAYLYMKHPNSGHVIEKISTMNDIGETFQTIADYIENEL